MLETYDAVLLKEWMWGSWSEAGEPRACHTEWSQTEKSKQGVLMHTPYTWNLDKQNRRPIYREEMAMQTQRTDLGTRAKEWVGPIEKVALTCMPSRVKLVTSRKLPYDTVSPAWHCMMTEKGEMRAGGFRGRACIYNYDWCVLLYGRDQHNNCLTGNYPPIEKRLMLEKMRTF